MVPGTTTHPFKVTRDFPNKYHCKVVIALPIVAVCFVVVCVLW
jgi:hypothetical protein